MLLLFGNLYRAYRPRRVLAPVFSWRVIRFAHPALLSSRLLSLMLVGVVWLLADSVCTAQSNLSWRATAARPYVLRGTERRLLDRAERFLAAEQWDDGVAALMRLLESENFSVVAREGENAEPIYVSLPEYCQHLLAQLPAAALARYRLLVDVTAEAWYRRGIAERAPALLQRVVDECFCSRWGDDALLALGELALERGDYQAAQAAWLQIVGADVEANIGSPGAAVWLVYPETDLSLADVRARLVLCAIRAGDFELAEVRLARLQEKFPGGRGRLAGREGEFAVVLAGLLKQARLGWRVEREKAGEELAENMQEGTDVLEALGELVWEREIENEGRAVFPWVVRGLVVCQDVRSVRAWKLSDGEEVFVAEGEVFRSPETLTASDSRARRGARRGARLGSKLGWLGRSRYELATNGRFVFGVTNGPLGLRPLSGNDQPTSTLWSLDLQRDGALALHQPSEAAGVSFVGPPIVKGALLWVPIASNGQTARAGIACYDLSTGERRWQRWLCQANTPATGRSLELVNKRLIYDSGILYMNTNLGAVGAIRAADGKILWLRTYQRSNTAGYYRGPSPCVVHFGTVFVLPTDAKLLLALHATTGSEIWRQPVVDLTARLVDVTAERVLIDVRGAQGFDPRTGKPKPIDDKAPASGQVVADGFLIQAEAKRVRVFRSQTLPTEDAVELSLPEVKQPAKSLPATSLP